MALNLRQIEVFRAVMITGTISGASQLLFVSQPAISRLLSHTEIRVGFALFERIKGRLYATPEAKKLFREVEAVYAGVQRVNQMAHDLHQHRDGILNIASSPSMGQLLIPQAIAKFRQRHPHVKVTLQLLGLGPLQERLLDGQADVGVTILPLTHPNLAQESIGSGRICCITPLDHPLNDKDGLGRQDLLEHPLISYDRDTAFGALISRYFQAVESPPRAAIEVGSPQNACALVQAGAGISLVDQFSALSWPSGNFVVHELADAPEVHVHLVHLRFEPLSSLAQDFVRHLRQLMACSPKTLTNG